MTDITSDVNQLLKDKHASTTIPQGQPCPPPSTATADEFLKEAYRINSHIHSLLLYLQSIRHSYLSTTPTIHPRTTSLRTRPTTPQSKPLTDTERDSIDSSTALLLRDLSTSITNLSSAESLRQETESGLLRKKHRAPSALLRWAAGASALAHPTSTDAQKSPEQLRDEEQARTLRTVRESILWFLRRGLERAAEAQRDMVEKRIERVREKEKSVLYKGRAAVPVSASTSVPVSVSGPGPVSGPTAAEPSLPRETLSETETAAIEAELSPEQLQLFAEENDLMLRQYEDALSKVQNAEKSLLEISSLQQTLVSHLATQEEYIEQLVTDASTTTSNIGQGNKELKRATQQRSTAQAVFWGTVGLCTWLVVWDLIF